MVVHIDRVPNMPTRIRRALEGIGSDFVPYTGAIKDTDLGAFDLMAAEITATTYASAYSIADFVVLHAGGGVGNTCVGIYAGLGLTTGTWNTLFGHSAGKAITTGIENICIGPSAGIALTIGDYNVLIGKEAGKSLIGDDGDVTIGDRNTFIGYKAGNLATKSYNLAIGSAACQYMTTGTKNTYLGHLTGADGAAGALTTGIENTYIGANSGRYNISNDRCTGIGYFTGASSGAADNLQGSVAIGATATFTASNQLVIGGDGANYRITDVYIGDGVVSAAPQDVAINATGGSGTDIEAKDLILAGGKSTGDAAPGDILFKTATAGASGTTLQTLTTRLTLTGVTADFSGLNLTTTGTVTTGTLTVADGSISDSDGTIAIGTGVGADILNLITNKVYITRGDLTLQSGGTVITAPTVKASTEIVTPEIAAPINSNLTLESISNDYDIVFSFQDDVVNKTFVIDASENTLNLNTGHLLTTGTITGSQFTNSSIIGDWRFDADAKDYSGNGYDGTLQGAASIADGVLRMALLPDYLDLDTHASAFADLEEGTISFWYNILTPTTAQFFIAFSDDSETNSYFLIWMDEADNKIHVDIIEAGTPVLEWESTAATYDATGWIHVVYSSDSTGNSIEINGLADAGTYTTGTSSTQAFIADVNDVDRFLVGYNEMTAAGSKFEMDNLEIYNRRLTTVERKSLYDRPSKNVYADEVRVASGVGIGVSPSSSYWMYIYENTPNNTKEGLFSNMISSGGNATAIHGIAQATGIGIAGHFEIRENTATLYGVKVGTAAATYGATQYGVYSDVISSGGGTTWNFFAGDGGNNYFGGDDVLSMWGTTNTDLRISSDGTDGIIAVANGLRLGAATTNYVDIQPDGEIQLVGSARVTNSLWIGAEGVRAPPITKPATYVEHGIGGAWEFSDATDDTILATIRIPNRMDRTVAPSITLGWSSATTDGYCEWQIEYLWRSPDEATNAAADDTLLSSTDADASTSSADANGLVLSTFPLVAPSITPLDACLHLRIKRRADLAADTINGDTTELFGICLGFTSDKLGTAT